MERLREENELLTNDYNGLRAHCAAVEAQAQARMVDLEQQLADACKRATEAGVAAAAAHASAQQDSSVGPSSLSMHGRHTL